MLAGGPLDRQVEAGEEAWAREEIKVISQVVQEKAAAPLWIDPSQLVGNLGKFSPVDS